MSFTFAPFKKPLYNFNPQHLDSFIGKLRSHQKDAFEAVKNDVPIGQVISPCATGKSWTQDAFIVSLMVDKWKRGEIGVFAKFTPRLLLNVQMSAALESLIFSCGIPVNILHISSDRINADEKYAQWSKEGVNFSTVEFLSTTKRSEINAFAQKTKEQNRFLLVIGTFKSMDKLSTLINIDALVIDEAHFMTSSNEYGLYESNLKEVYDKSDIKYVRFFTATPKISGNNYGMNNANIYGDRLYTLPTRSAIDAAEIVPTTIVRVRPLLEGDDYRNTAMAIKNILLAWEDLEKQTENKWNNGLFAAKLLVANTGNPQQVAIRTDPGLINFCQQNDITLVSFSSDKGYYIDGRKVKRKEAYRYVRDLPSEKRAIILHICMLTEGIDLPDLNGVLSFRNLSIADLVQTLGRAQRLFSRDRAKLYSGEIKAENAHKEFVKSECYVYIAETFIDEPSQMIGDIVELSEYRIKTEEIQVITDLMGQPDNGLAPIVDPDSPNSRLQETDLSCETIDPLFVVDSNMFEKVWSATEDRVTLIEEWFPEGHDFLNFNDESE